MLKNKISVLFICPYPTNQAPSQRFRFEQYFELLLSNGFHVNVSPFINASTWKILYNPGHSIQKLLGVTIGFVKRFLLLPFVSRYDFIFIHREATPFGPPWFEWFLAKILKKKIIYDFDDAIWLTDKKDETRLAKFVRWRSKIANICKWSFKVSCGNQYLLGFAKKYNRQAVLIPTTIDTESCHNPLNHKKNDSGEVIIGWTGSHSTLKFLHFLDPVLESLKNKCDQKFKLLVIADKEPKLSFMDINFIKWNKESEIEDLMKIDIGLMPLTSDEWSLGKCGFKALQYLSLNIPAVVSPVGVNLKIVEHGVNGFVCSTNDEWENSLQELIMNKTLRETLGANGRRKIIDEFSVNSNNQAFLNLFAN